MQVEEKKLQTRRMRAVRKRDARRLRGKTTTTLLLLLLLLCAGKLQTARAVALPALLEARTLALLRRALLSNYVNGRILADGMMLLLPAIVIGVLAVVLWGGNHDFSTVTMSVAEAMNTTTTPTYGPAFRSLRRFARETKILVDVTKGGTRPGRGGGIGRVVDGFHSL